MKGKNRAFSALVDFGFPPCFSEEVIFRAPKIADLISPPKLENLGNRLRRESPRNFHINLILENPEAAFTLTPDEISGRTKFLISRGVPWEDVPGLIKT